MALRRTILLLTAIAFSAASNGFPIPQFGGTISSTDEDFPCRGHNCGCRDAETCRTSCCCGLSVATKDEESTEAGGGCCSSKADEDADCDDPASGGYVIQALTCTGVSVMYVALGIVVSISSDVLSIAPRVGHDTMFVADEFAHTFPIDPPMAPPRA